MRKKVRILTVAVSLCFVCPIVQAQFQPKESAKGLMLSDFKAMPLDELLRIFCENTEDGVQLPVGPTQGIGRANLGIKNQIINSIVGPNWRGKIFRDCREGGASGQLKSVGLNRMTTWPGNKPLAMAPFSTEVLSEQDPYAKIKCQKFENRNLKAQDIRLNYDNPVSDPPHAQELILRDVSPVYDSMRLYIAPNGIKYYIGVTWLGKYKNGNFSTTLPQNHLAMFVLTEDDDSVKFSDGEDKNPRHVFDCP